MEVFGRVHGCLREGSFTFIIVWVVIPLSWGTVTIGGLVVNGEAANKIQVLQLSYKVVAWIQLNGYNESC